ncbi:carbamoyl phosphate synthase small subunit [Heyndrickxia ginsengihumi]|uniref:carbamoyl phosphate synthase small subunit n=1 Tax=Heyndrickxia ginsengihumi TaxID=363870 RepID=UPI001DE1C9AE|nr:carbamoyl phosphate synthase small subunit [Heyndrickxia ginsengihumi]MBE6183106.1 carbamoyl phosphate synthase small subunit [Bacillus sp. (in: firmicutes)]MCM3023881.1 carbamoyl phosphate synthase small subunit [Heyndrickxia ginsengihumi]
MKNGYIILETGEMFEGHFVGEEQDVHTVGEVVFNTSMTGYQEIMTDPSYAGQIIVFCYPLIGNYGVNEEDYESIKVAAHGMITGEICEEPSFYKAESSAISYLQQFNIPCLTGVDTRALVKTIRKHGTVKGLLTTDKTKQLPASDNGFYIPKVSTTALKTCGEGTKHIVLMDFGYKKSIVDYLLKHQCKVTIVPYNYTCEQIKALQPDGVVLSNGPGDPMQLQQWLPEIKQVSESFPTLGICLGHQLLALANGAKTKKLPFGHRGGNHPVKDIRTGKVFITSQNHGYVVEDESIDETVMKVVFRNVNDGTVEGCIYQNKAIMTVQFHPEAHPGPQDTEYIFTQFLQQVQQKAGVFTYANQ